MIKHRGQQEMDFGIRVGAVVEREGRLLLVGHQKPDREPYWVLPGGRLEPGETIPECARRELAEETNVGGAEFCGVQYVSEFMREGRHTVDVTVRLVVGPEDEASLGNDPEVEEGSEPTLREVRWVSIEELREIELLPPWIKRRIIEDAGDWAPPENVYLHGGRD